MWRIGVGKKPNPNSTAPAANGNVKFNQATLNAASKQLSEALTKVANQHVLRYANVIRTNATEKARKGYVSQANLNKEKAAEANAKAAAEAAEAAAAAAGQPPPNATLQTLEAEAAAIIASIKTVGGPFNTNGKLNMVKLNQNSRYIQFKNRTNVKNAINSRTGDLT